MNLGDKELHAFGKECVEIIRDNIKNKKVGRFIGMNASGRTANETRYEVNENALYVWGAGHIFVLETGRKPTERAGSGETLLVRIRKWIDEKPIIPYGDISKDSLAYLFTRRIHEQGTLLHQMGGKSGILSEVINKERTDKLLQQLLFNFKAVVKSTLIEN